MTSFDVANSIFSDKSQLLRTFQGIAILQNYKPSAFLSIVSVMVLKVDVFVCINRFYL